MIQNSVVEIKGQRRIAGNVRKNVNNYQGTLYLVGFYGKLSK